MYHYKSPNSTHPPFPSWYLCICSLHLHLYFWLANKIICTIFLDSKYLCTYMCYLFFSFWLISLCMTLSRFIHIFINDPTLFFLWLNNIPLYMYIIFFIHSFANAHLTPEMIKLLEKKHRTLFDINSSKIFFDPLTRVMKVKTKITK